MKKALALLAATLLASCSAGAGRETHTYYSPEFNLLDLEGYWDDDLFGGVSMDIEAYNSDRGTALVEVGNGNQTLGMVTLTGDNLQLVLPQAVVMMRVVTVSEIAGMGRTFRRIY